MWEPVPCSAHTLPGERKREKEKEREGRKDRGGGNEWTHKSKLYVAIYVQGNQGLSEKRLVIYVLTCRQVLQASILKGENFAD